MMASGYMKALESQICDGKADVGKVKEPANW